MPSHCDQCSTSVHCEDFDQRFMNGTSGRKCGLGLYFSFRGHRNSSCRPARPVQPRRPGLVRGDLRGSDAGPGRGLGRHLGRPPHADPRADGQRQDPRRVPLDPRPAGTQPARRQTPTSSPARFASSTSRPLKALTYDVERNLRAPLAGIAPGGRPTGRAGAGHHASRAGPATRRPRIGATSPAGRRTSSSRPPNRCTCCSPARPATSCVASST